MRLGEFKQEVIRLSNDVNTEIFGRGYKWQKVYIKDNRICIIAKCEKSKALYTIEKLTNLLKNYLYNISGRT